MSLICSPDDKPRLEARNGVDQLGYIDYLINTLRAVELRESHILEFHEAVAHVYPCGGQYRDAHYVRALRVADSSVRDGRSPDLGPMRAIVEDAIVRQLASAVDALSRPRDPAPSQ